MDYFCYISRRKVDTLLANLEETESDGWKESEQKEVQTGGKVEAGVGISGILNLFKGEATYGRKGTVQMEREVKRQYLHKLRVVLSALASNPGVYPLPTDLARIGDSLYYHYVGEFSPSEPLRDPSQAATVTLKAMLGRETALLLDCSLRFFSEGNTPDGQFIIHSGNARFFQGKVTLCLETVFILLQHKKQEVIGTPLFLKLRPREASSSLIEI
jgi:hypothetical protein